MEKIKVDVCLGTTCFVMGGSHLQELTEILPRKYGDKVEVNGSTCLEMCSNNTEYSKAPYVRVNDEIISEATIEKVLEKINEILNK